MKGIEEVLSGFLFVLFLFCFGPWRNKSGKKRMFDVERRVFNFIESVTRYFLAAHRKTDKVS